MSLVTLLAGWLAVRFDSILVAVLGILGGYLTPVMLSTGTVNFPGLFGYLLVLGAGVLGLCWWKNWPLVNYLSFFGTYALFFAAMSDYEPRYFRQVMPFAVAFFVLFSTMTFLYKIVNQAKSNLLDLLALLLNAGIFFGVSYGLVEPTYGSKRVALVTLALAAFYTLHVYGFLRRKLVDRELLIAFIGLASFFLAVTVPLAISNEWITVSWALQAAVMLWIAGKIGSRFLRHVAYLLYAIVIFRFGVLDLPRNFLDVPPAIDPPWSAYLRLLLERAVVFGIPIASLAAGARLLRLQAAAVDGPVDSENDIPNLIRERDATWLALGGAGFMLFVYLHFELQRTVGYFYPPIRTPLVTLLWIAACAVTLRAFLKTDSRLACGLFLGFVGGLLVKLVGFDLPGWNVTESFLYAGAYSFRDALLRLVDFGAVVGFFTAAYALLAPRVEQRRLAAGFAVLAVVGLFVYLTLETNTFLHAYLEGLRSGGISILWSLFALALIVGGIARRVRPVRYAGLTLFAVVAWKVFFVDLARLDQFYRIVAFLLLGVLALCGSFVYLRFREAFAVVEPIAEKKP